MKEAVKVIRDMIANEVEVLNMLDNADGEALDRRLMEIKGMLICLKNINKDGRFYNLSASTDGHSYEFGYFEEDGRWVKIA